MGNLNKAMLIGRLGAKPEKRHTTSGAAVATLNLATTEYFNDKAGTRRERTEWLRVVLWDRLADLAEQYLDKGSQVYIEGRIQTREWLDKDGNKRYTTEIVGNQMQFLDKPAQQGGGAPYGAGAPSGSDYYGDPSPSYGNPPSQSYGVGGQGYDGHAAPSKPAPNIGPSSGEDFIEDDVPF